MSGAGLGSDSIKSEESVGEGGIAKKEHDLEKAGIPLSLPIHQEISRPKASLERPHTILPDAWLDIEGSEIINDDGTSSRICFGMVRMKGILPTTTYLFQC
jgi:hypothetical protein